MQTRIKYNTTVIDKFITKAEKSCMYARVSKCRLFSDIWIYLQSGLNERIW